MYDLCKCIYDDSIMFYELHNLHPVSITRFPSFRTQTLENLSVDSVENGFLSNPDPGENLASGNLVMETGCTVGLHNFNLRIFSLRVSNPGKLIVDVFLTRCRISMFQWRPGVHYA